MTKPALSRATPSDKLKVKPPSGRPPLSTFYSGRPAAMLLQVRSSLWTRDLLSNICRGCQRPARRPRPLPSSSMAGEGQRHTTWPSIYLPSRGHLRVHRSYALTHSRASVPPAQNHMLLTPDLRVLHISFLFIYFIILTIIFTRINTGCYLGRTRLCNHLGRGPRAGQGDKKLAIQWRAGAGPPRRGLHGAESRGTLAGRAKLGHSSPWDSSAGK